MAGLTSGTINGNSFPITFLGIFDYIKNFLVIFIYAAFFRDFNDFKKIFRYLFCVALFIATIGLVQFLWAMGSVYVLNKNILDPSVYIFFNSSPYGQEVLKEIIWRYGIFRSPFCSYDLALYCLLILTIYLYSMNKAVITAVIMLIMGVVVSASRMAYAALMLILSIQVFNKGMKWIVPLVLMLALVGVLFLNNFASQLSTQDFFKETTTEDVSPDIIRPYTRYKAIEIWKDHPIWGVGPGMFGGIVASKFNSSIYDEYNIMNQYYINSVGGIEQFWFQILAETGIIGTLFFGGLFITLFVILCKSKERAVNEDMKGLFSALIFYMFCILIYSMGSGINIASVLFTYCAITGIALGCSLDSSSED